MKVLTDLMKITEFIIKEGQNIVISDPCYDARDIVKDSKEGCLFIREAKPGVWTYEFDKDTKTLDVYEKRSMNSVRDYGINTIIFDEVLYIGTDSGQFGVFTEDSFNNDELIKDFKLDIDYVDIAPWFRSCRTITTSGDEAGFIPNGFVSATKNGNGYYPVGIKYEKRTKKVSYIRVITDDMCEYCNKEESLCDCPECKYCGKKEHECSCNYCFRCGYKENECFC